MSGQDPSLAPVHPRACGERRYCITYVRNDTGSSPRVRGTVFIRLCYDRGIRFIPARAGNGFFLSRFVCCLSVHPRACGEREDYPEAAVALYGSSPRVRGTAHWINPTRPPCRFIPARAGNGSSSFLMTSSASVHPRACGERACSTRSLTDSNGSSPRVRGTDGDLVRQHVEHRFIPARAGNGGGQNLQMVNLTVHPRACGERQCRGRLAVPVHGSSPRVRGTAHSRLMRLS